MACQWECLFEVRWKTWYLKLGWSRNWENRQLNWYFVQILKSTKNNYMSQGRKKGAPVVREMFLMYRQSLSKFCSTQDFSSFMMMQKWHAFCRNYISNCEFWFFLGFSVCITILKMLGRGSSPCGHRVGQDWVTELNWTSLSSHKLLAYNWDLWILICISGTS